MNSVAKQMSLKNLNRIKPKINSLKMKIMVVIKHFPEKYNRLPNYLDVRDFLNKDRINVSSRISDLRRKDHCIIDIDDPNGRASLLKLNEKGVRCTKGSSLEKMRGLQR